MVIVSPLTGVVSLPNGHFMACKWGAHPNHLRPSWDDPPSGRGSASKLQNEDLKKTGVFGELVILVGTGNHLPSLKLTARPYKRWFPIGISKLPGAPIFGGHVSFREGKKGLDLHWTILVRLFDTPKQI